MLKLTDRSLETTHSYISSSGGTVMTSQKLAETGSAAAPPAPRLARFGGWAHAWTTSRDLEIQSPAPRPPQAETGQRPGELKESMYRDEPLEASAIYILDPPDFGLDEAAAFEFGKRFMRLPRPREALRSWMAPLDDVDS